MSDIKTVQAKGVTKIETAVAFQRVRRAHEQVADQLRELIIVGTLTPGARLPTEQEFALQLGVSRATVREALRSLTAEGLVRTSQGAGGGSFVSQPSLARVSSYLSTNIRLLSDAETLSLSEFLEARALIEIPAARLAAERRSNGDVDRLRAAIPGEHAPDRMPTGEQFEMNRDFHSTIVDICSNALLTLAMQPIFMVLQTRLARARLDRAFHRTINQQHVSIANAIEVGEGDRAADLMADHLKWLGPAYERAWRSLGPPK